MSYIDQLTEKVNQVFDRIQDPEDLREKVITLVQSVAKESFKNGCETGRGGSFRQKSQKAK